MSQKPSVLLHKLKDQLRVILVEPSHPGNVGAAARALKVMGLARLDLVNPARFPDPVATARAAGAGDVLAAVQVHTSLQAALADCHYAYACSARERSLAWPCYNAREAGMVIRQQWLDSKEPLQLAIVFGCERSGLSNDDLACCQAQIKFNCAADYSSLNLAAAVQLVSYELRMALLQPLQADLPQFQAAALPTDAAIAASDASARQLDAAAVALADQVSQQPRLLQGDQAASLQQLEGLYRHLAQQMQQIGFLDRRHSKALMQRMRRFFQQRTVGQKELNIWRGFLTTVGRYQNTLQRQAYSLQATVGDEHAIPDVSVLPAASDSASTSVPCSVNPEAVEPATPHSETAPTAILYFDNMATTPVAPAARLAQQACLKSGLCANSGSNHPLGWDSKQQLADATARFAACIAADPETIVWTSGATEANQLALRGAIAHYARAGRNKIITCSTEHQAVLQVCKHLQQQAYPLQILDVQADGRLNLEKVDAACSDGAVLLSVMLVNNETGVIQDIAAIADITQRYGVLLHVDAAQALGKVPINLQRLAVDFMSFSGHKCYAPVGVGALYVRAQPQRHLQPQMLGGGQQAGRRSGTLPLPLITAMAHATEFATRDMAADLARVRHLQQSLLRGIQEIFPVELNGSAAHRVPHNLNLYFPGLHGETLLYRLTQVLCVSQAAACHGAGFTPSHVLLAMGQSAQRASSSIRFSLSNFTTTQDIASALIFLRRVLPDLQQLTVTDAEAAAMRPLAALEKDACVTQLSAADAIRHAVENGVEAVKNKNKYFKKNEKIASSSAVQQEES